MHEQELSVISHTKSYRLHPSVTARPSVAGHVVDVFGPQTERTVVAVSGSDSGIGDDGTTSQTTECCLTKTKSFLLNFFVCIRKYYTMQWYTSCINSMNYDKELEFGKQLALKAGDIILKNFSRSSATVKSNLTPVTETDVAVSKLVIEEVGKRFPNHAVLDEEVQHDVPEEEYVWVCDPVDGTVPFAYHVPTSVFSLALCKNKQPVVAVVYDPYMKRLYCTVEGGSAYLNGKEIRVKDGGFEKGDFIYGIPTWYEPFDTNTYMKLLLEKSVRVTYIESIVYQCMLVASGLTRAMLSVSAKPWDRAAALFLVENAGGKCTDEHGTPFIVFGDHTLFVATNGIVHDEMLALVRECLPRLD